MRNDKEIYYALQYLLTLPLAVPHPTGGIVNPLLLGKTPWTQGLHGNEATGGMHLVQEEGGGRQTETGRSDKVACKVTRHV